MNGCEICQQPEDDHPAYAAGAGVHDYQIPVTGPFPVTDMDRLARERREAGLDEGGRPLQVPTIVPHPDGGVTQEWVETPSDRLPSFARGTVAAAPSAPPVTTEPGMTSTDQPPWWRRILGSST